MLRFFAAYTGESRFGDADSGEHTWSHVSRWRCALARVFDVRAACRLRGATSCDDDDGTRVQWSSALDYETDRQMYPISTGGIDCKR